MPSATLPSPAKLNLFLHITGRRDDGYPHTCKRYFSCLDFGDTLTFKTNSSGKITLSPQIANVVPDDNLIIRAARLLQEKTGCTQGCDIVLGQSPAHGRGSRRRQQQCCHNPDWAQ